MGQAFDPEKFQQLKHARRKLPGGGQVMCIDTGAAIPAEALAMAQAMHSRSMGGMDAHLQKVAARGPEAFMQQYYVEYGDKSIGDCGDTTVSIDGVSMLVAKAIQHFALYNGQEASTRYIDFSKQKLINPHGSTKGEHLLESLRAMHLEGLEVMRSVLPHQHPMQPDEKEAVWQKALNARGFDIMRSLLPAGAMTNLSWHDNLRQLGDHMVLLRNHPLEEVRTTAEAIYSAVDEMHPSSFKPPKDERKREEQKVVETYVREWMSDLNYFDFDPSEKLRTNNTFLGVMLEYDGIDDDLLAMYRKYLEGRPRKAEIPKIVAECGVMRFSFMLDFGSFRDLQRQRALTQRMPLLTMNRGFRSWYTDQMPDNFRTKVESFLRSYRSEVESLGLTPELKQYYVPMGYNVACRITGDLAAHAWWLELRSPPTTHPTLRHIAQATTALVRERHPEVKLHVDENPDRFYYRRGTQDIVERPAASA
jgi:thymidylate synthase ThyX